MSNDTIGGTQVAAGQVSAFSGHIRVVDANRGAGWLRDGWDLFTRAPVVWLVVLVVFLIVSFGLSALSFLGMLTTVLVPLFVAGLLNGCRTLARGERLELQHILDGFQRNTPNLLMLGLIDLAIAFAGGLILFMAIIGTIGMTALTAMSTDTFSGAAFVGGMFFVLFLGLAISIPTAMAMWFAPALVSFHDVAPLEAVKSSFVACARNWLAFVVYGLVLVLLSFASILTFGLGFFVLIPVVWISMYTSYVDVFETPDQPETSQIAQL